MTQQPQLLFDRIDERVWLARQENDFAYFHALRLKFEYLTKIVVSGMIACIEDDADRYSLEYELVHRANSIGTWLEILNDALSSKHLIHEALGLARDITERVGPGDWRHAAVNDLYQAARVIGVETNDPKGKVALKQFFHIGVQLRNKGPGHGATTARMFSESCPELASALDAVRQNLEIFRLPWVYLHRNLSGSYRVRPLLNECSSFDYLRGTRDVQLPNGVFFRLNDQAHPIHVPLIFFDSDSNDIFLPNEKLTGKKFETLSYFTGKRLSQDGSAWLKPLETARVKHDSARRDEKSAEDPRTIERGEASGGSSIKKMYMVRGGSKGVHFGKFLERGVVAIGWPQLGDLSRYESREAIREALLRKFPGLSPRPAAVWTDNLFGFSRELPKSDFVITYNPTRQLYAVGKIAGEYTYDPEFFAFKTNNFPNYIRVDWNPVRFSRSQLSDPAKKALGSQLTVFRLKNEAVVEEILGLVRNGRQ